MKRSGPLVRRTPLERGTVPLARTRSTKTRRLKRPAMDRVLREQVFIRAGGRCDRCRGVILAGDGFHAHHRQLRSRGGEDSLANLVALCPPCHEWVHAHPNGATSTGWQVPSWERPATVPVLLHGTSWALPGNRWTPTTEPEGLAS